MVSESCYHCDGEMVELEDDIEGMTEGQQADYTAGFNHTFQCLKCGETTIRDGTSLHVEFPDEMDSEDEETYPFEEGLTADDISPVRVKSTELMVKPRCQLAKENILRGDMHEYLVGSHFRTLGYSVVKLVQYLGRQHHFNRTEALEALTLGGNSPLAELLDRMSESSVSGFPDFLVIKENEQPFFVECKAKPETLRENQKEVIAKLVSQGYKVYLYCTRIQLPKIKWDRTHVYEFDKKAPLNRTTAPTHPNISSSCTRLTPASMPQSSSPAEEKQPTLKRNRTKSASPRRVSSSCGGRARR